MMVMENSYMFMFYMIDHFDLARMGSGSKQAN